MGINKKIFVTGTVFLAIAVCMASIAFGQHGPRENEQETGTELDALIEELSRFKLEHAALSAAFDELESRLGASADSSAPTVQDVEVPEGSSPLLFQLRDQVRSLLPGSNNLLIAGFAAANFRDQQGRNSTFGAVVAPIILWKPSDRLLFETELEFELEESSTEVNLGYAHLTYLVNDYVTAGAGKILLPFGTFWERWHPPWINKLPTPPLINAHGGGLIGESGLGMQLRGGVRLGTTKLNYSAYLINGPSLAAEEHDEEEEEHEIGGGGGGHGPSPGGIGFDLNEDNNNNKSVGARVGFLPIPELELGYSVLFGRVDSSGTSEDRVDTLMQGVDLTYAREFDWIKGRLELRAEAVLVDTDDVHIEIEHEEEEEGDEGRQEEILLNNEREGYFVQLAYRPTLADVPLFAGIELKDFEFVGRYDRVQLPGPEAIGVDREHWTIGLDYWIEPNAVVKAAYIFEDVNHGEDENTFLLQFAIGF